MSFRFSGNYKNEGSNILLSVTGLFVFIVSQPCVTHRVRMRESVQEETGARVSLDSVAANAKLVR